MKFKQLKNSFNINSILILLFCWQSGVQLKAQNIGMNGTGANPHASALLDVDATGGPATGLLIPRIALTAINVAAPVTSPATSLLVYNTATASTGTTAVSPGYYYWDATKWVRFAYNASGSSSTAWDLLGNAGTTAGTNFVGTTDAKDLVFKTNNLEAVRITTVGALGMGTPNPSGWVHINKQTSSNLATTFTAVGIPHIVFTDVTGGDNSLITGFGNGILLSTNLLNYNNAISSSAEPTPELYLSGNPNGLNLGIGTFTPQSKIHIVHPNTNLLRLSNTTSSYTVPAWQNYIRFDDGTTMAGYIGDGGSLNRISMVGHWDNQISIASYSSNTNASENASIELSGSINTLPRSILFRTANVQRAIIDDNGNMGIGTTTPTVPLQIGTAMHFGRGGLTGASTLGSDIAFTGGGVISSQSNLEINIDSDNNATGSAFIINTDADFSAPTELFRVQENGRVGIGTGTTSVGARVHILADNPTMVSNADNDVLIDTYSDTYDNLFYMRRARGIKGAENFLQTGDNMAAFAGSAWNGAGFTQGGGITMEAMKNHTATDLTSRMLFAVNTGTSNTTLLQIKGENPSGIGSATAPVLQIGPAIFINEGNGNTGIGPDLRCNASMLMAADDGITFNIDGDANVAEVANTNSGTNFNFRHNTYTSAGALLFRINEGGGIYNGSGTLYVASDKRVKTINGDFTDGLNIIKKLNPIKYHYNEKAPFKVQQEQIGVIAQDLEQVAPYMVELFPAEEHETDFKDLKVINTQAYTFLLINAVKELSEKVEKLEKQIETLKNK